jgi:hypothetical protein
MFGNWVRILDGWILYNWELLYVSQHLKYGKIGNLNEVK